MNYICGICFIITKPRNSAIKHSIKYSTINPELNNLKITSIINKRQPPKNNENPVFIVAFISDAIPQKPAIAPINNNPLEINEK